MDTERWGRISAVFDQVVEVPLAERSALLDRTCNGNDAMRCEVQSLLDADAAGYVLERHAPKLRNAVAVEWARDVDATPVGHIIGSWRVLRELGRGGMGIVMLAERVDGQFEQRVALKLIKRGMDSEAVLARFRRERQILARLSHPHIARLLDGGLSADDRPYFVMEYVEGAPILDYCAAHSLDRRARLRLALQICAALQFAHRQLVVHLDIKPSNVIVTDYGEVKLLDFGIAKLLGEQLADACMMTQAHRQRPLTPGYASPEQLLGEPVSTATDVYGIGCLLYEVLTGHRAVATAAQGSPDGLPQGPHPGDEPWTPSQAGSTQTGHDAPLQKLRGDLDTIVRTALQHEPERRYPTVDALAADLHRFLDGQPIAARRDTLVYRTGKFVARHQVGVGLAILGLAGLIATATFAFMQAANARAHAMRAQAVTQYLVDVFRVADPKRTGGGLQLSAREVLDAGARRLQSQLQQQPQLEASFSIVLGNIYQGLGENDRAIDLFQRSLNLRVPDGPGDVTRADSLALLARAEYEKGDYTSAAATAAQARDEHLALGRADSSMIANDLALQGEIARRQGDFVKGVALLTQALAMSRATLTSPHAQIAAQLNQLAALNGDMNRIEEATHLTEQALAMFRTLYGENHLDVAENLVNLGVFLMQTDRVAVALPAFDEAIAVYRHLLPANHPLLALALANEARAFDRLKRYRDADPLYREALKMQQLVLGGQHPDLATTLNNLAVLRIHVDDFAGSARYSREAMAIWAAQGNPEHPFALISKTHLAAALRESGDLAQCEVLTREVLAARQRQLGDGNRGVAMSLDDLGVVLRLTGHSYQAVIEHRRAQSIRERLSDVPPQEAAAALVQFALSESDIGSYENARRDVNAGIAQLTSMKSLDQEQLASATLAGAAIELAGHNVSVGCALARQALLMRPTDDPITGWRHAEAQAVFGECLAQLGHSGAARYQLQSALAALERVRGMGHWMTRRVRSALLALQKT